MTDLLEFPEVFIANYLNTGNLPAMLGQYCFQRHLYWNQIYDTHRMWSQVNPGDQRSLEDGKK